mgnify:CR=1 FL=1
MGTLRSRRKLSNISLTRKYHFRYFGSWLLMTAGLVLAANAMLYLFFDAHCAKSAVLNPELTAGQWTHGPQAQQQQRQRDSQD